MNKFSKGMAALSILLFITVLLGGCGATQPTQQLAVEPATQTQAPAATPMPPTPTPLPTTTLAPTATQIPPTPTPEGYAPLIVDLVDLSVSDGERFPKINLDDHVSDEDHTAGEIQWQISNNDELELRLVGSNLFVSLPRVDWTGAETLRFEACDPHGLCDSQDVVFTVRAENDAPVVSVGGQIIMPGETFARILLDDFVHDEDNADDELTWNASGNVDLDVTIDERAATIEAADGEWRGTETIQFKVCDPEGACGSRETTFSVVERADTQVEVTYIGNAGFMITIADKKILIDALFEEPSLPRELVESLEKAQPPFDDVDLILATHNHFDHFDAQKVRSHLENNLGAIFVSARDAASAVAQIGDVRDQTIPIQLQQRAGEKTYLVVDGIGLEIVYLSHGGPILNLAYIITLDGRRLFHTGDMDPDSVPVSELQRHGLPDKQIDIAFVPHFMLITEEQHAHVTKGIQARHIVPMHYQFTMPPPDYDLMDDYFPDAIVFHESMESWVLPGTP